ncbi:MAG TPA: DNA topoisomerase, partial [bacterium]|nr:DNA topoisomerase [bacterium]
MGKKLVIVESPTKAKTIKYILGSEYIVTSTLGHIRDLPEHTFGVDLETFTPAYEILPGKKKIVAYLKKLVGQSDSIFLATDEDREGEAIAWHTATVLDKDINEVKRVAFHEITKDAVVKSFKNPRTIDMNLVSAQQARRILDRIVGYSISPLLGKNLSAGRVQSVALQMIVIREKEIQNFIPEPYWTIYIIVEHTNKQFKMKMVSINGEKIGQQGLKNKEQVKKHINALKNRDIVIKSVDKTIKNIRPYPPFTTSSLQQEAS